MFKRWSRKDLFDEEKTKHCSFSQDDTALNHAACKIIENLLLVSDKQAEKLATMDIALALWNISSIVGNNEHLRASALGVVEREIFSCLSSHLSLSFRLYVIWVYRIQMCFNQ